MSCKAGIYVANTTTQSLAAGATIVPGTIVRRYGNKCGNPIVNLSGNGVVLNEIGYYDIEVNVTDAPTAAGAVTVTLFQDGTPITGAVSTSAAAANSDATGVVVPAMVRVLNCGGSVITAVLTSGAGNVTNFTIKVIKL